MINDHLSLSLSLHTQIHLRSNSKMVSATTEIDVLDGCVEDDSSPHRRRLLRYFHPSKFRRFEERDRDNTARLYCRKSQRYLIRN